MKDTKPTIREKEVATEGSGGSLYPPLPIYYFCEECQKTQITKIEEKNKYEREADLPLTIPTGREGFTWSWIQQIMMTSVESELLTAVDPDNHTYLPFTCSCGARYELGLRLKKRDKIDHPRFAIVLGFHNKCNGCKHAFDKSIGTEHFKFRCDKNLQCPHMFNLRDKSPNKIWTIDE